MKKTTLKRYVSRGSQAGQIIGRAEDGTRIMRPSFKPQGITLREIEKAIRAVREREAVAKAG
ncbi:MAG: hypothetical protein WAT70_05610 [Rhizobiaceae bacterium]